MNPDNPNFRTPEEEARAKALVKAEETIAEQASLIKLLQASECQPFDAYYKTCEVHYGLLQEDFKKQVEENEILKNKNTALIAELQDNNEKLEKEAKAAICTSPMLCFFKKSKKVQESLCTDHVFDM